MPTLALNVQAVPGMDGKLSEASSSSGLGVSRDPHGIPTA